MLARRASSSRMERAATSHGSIAAEKIDLKGTLTCYLLCEAGVPQQGNAFEVALEHRSSGVYRRSRP